VLIVLVEAFGSVFVNFFVVEVFAFEVVDTVVEYVGGVAGFEVAFRDGGEEAFANLSEDVGREVFMVGQRGLYSTWRHGHGVRGLDTGRGDGERRVGSFDG
jgi:hypothetical protein